MALCALGLTTDEAMGAWGLAYTCCIPLTFIEQTQDPHQQSFLAVSLQVRLTPQADASKIVAIGYCFGGAFLLSGGCCVPVGCGSCASVIAALPARLALHTSCAP